MTYPDFKTRIVILQGRKTRHIVIIFILHVGNLVARRIDEGERIVEVSVCPNE